VLALGTKLNLLQEGERNAFYQTLDMILGDIFFSQELHESIDPPFYRLTEGKYKGNVSILWEFSLYLKGSEMLSERRRQPVNL
jgi:hypothetical protein